MGRDRTPLRDGHRRVQIWKMAAVFRPTPADPAFSLQHLFLHLPRTNPAFAGDITCQLIAIEVARREGGEEESTTRGGGGNEQHEGDDFLDDLETSDAAAAAAESEIDWGRTARFTFVGATVLAPALHFWYGFLIRTLPGTAPATVVKRVLLDQLVFAPVFLAGFLSTIMVLDGNAAKVMFCACSRWYGTPSPIHRQRNTEFYRHVVYFCWLGFGWCDVLVFDAAALFGWVHA